MAENCRGLQAASSHSRIRYPLARSGVVLLFFSSGAAGLGYQILWARMLGLGLGHEMPAVLAVVGGFMGGMALGAAVLDRRIAIGGHAARWYGGLELVIGLWGLASILFVPCVNDRVPHLIGLSPSPVRHWLVSLAVPGLMFLPATAAMGATFPAMERFLSLMKGEGRWVGGVYAANTLGAVLGVLGTTFVLAPALGYRAAVGIWAVVNLGCGLAVLVWSGKMGAGGKFPGQKDEARGPGTNGLWGGYSRVGLRVGLMGTGMLGIGYEVLGVRELSQVMENTVYTYAWVLAVYLSGTAMGAAWYQRWGRRLDGMRLGVGLTGGLGLACALGMRSMAVVSGVYEWLRGAWGGGWRGGIAAEMGVAAMVFGVPTLLMGALFSHLVQGMKGQGGGIGRGLALNTLGGSVAGVVFLVVLMPWVGWRWAAGLLATGYLLLMPRCRVWRWALVAGTLLLVLLPPYRLRLVEVPPGGKMVAYREGILATVAVVEEETGERILRVDNRFQMGGTAAAKAEYRHAHLPLLMHPAPRRALFLGLGTGITMGGALAHPGLQATGVELVPEVMEVMPAFEPFNGHLAARSNVTLYGADARRFVRTEGPRYDVIVADLFHPARDGAGALYTVEHFQAVKGRLTGGGLFCQWLPLHQMDEAMLRTVTATFLEVYPEAQGWLLRLSVEAPVLGLVGFKERRRYDPGWVERRLGDKNLKEALVSLGLADTLRFLGGLIADTGALKALAGDAPLNTDNRPRVTYDAPSFVYGKPGRPYDRLLGIMGAMSAHRERVVAEAVTGEEGWRAAIVDYMKARDIYLRGLAADAEGRNEEAIEAYLESARLSGEFTAGYAQCLTIASLWARENVARARELLSRLTAAQPGRAVAGEMLRRLEEKP